jgi:uncharacterized coiled-coil protein SlyX
MTPQEEVVELLKRIEANQRKALDGQQEQLAIVKAQFQRSDTTIKESVELQKLAVARAAQVRNIALPLIIVLMALLVYLLVRWRVF